jgi:16S rRNA (guanine966-N2)-methyltransferase
LATPDDNRVRPTSDKVRQAIFNVLAHSDTAADFALDGARVIDLFSGTGALGIEALSRGASFCVFIDTDAASRALVRRNVETLGLTGVTKIWRRDATALGLCESPPSALAFLDPPYRQGLLAPALQSLHEGHWLTKDAIAVIESAQDEEIAIPDVYAVEDERLYGETCVRFLRYKG